MSDDTCLNRKLAGISNDSFQNRKQENVTDLPSLNALRAFDAVARLQSVSAAAAELSVTPSAISRQISNLEEDIGIALLTREGRGLRLTADGRRLESGLADAFAQIASAVERLRQPSRGDRLRMLVPPMFASAWLLPRLDRFRALRPGTDVILIDKEEQSEIASAADLVIAWGRFEDDATRIAERLTKQEELFPVCRQHICPGGSLTGATLLHREAVGNAWRWMEWTTFLEAVGLNGAGVVEGPRLAAGLLLDVTRRGKGVMLANTTVAHDDLAAGRLVRPIAESMATEDSYWLLVSRTERNRPEVVAFRRWLVDELAACFSVSH